MTFTKGNKAIANHAADGKDLLLFEMLGKGRVRFRGPFNCAGYEIENGLDQFGINRKVIVFNLVPVADEGAEIEPPVIPKGAQHQSSTHRYARPCGWDTIGMS